MKVLLVGHACCPDRGSEPGLTWNWASHLARHHDVHVLSHPQHRAETEAALRRDRRPLAFTWVGLPAAVDPWNPAQDGRGIHLHYVIWQHLAYRTAARLHAQHHFDIVHHVSWGTVSAPPLLWRLPVPFVWGPVGGGQTVPSGFEHYLGNVAMVDRLRDVRMRLLPWRPLARKAARRSALLLATNRETRDMLKRLGGRDIRLAYDNGVLPSLLPPAPPERPVRRELTLLWAGRIEPLKALPLALESLARLGDVPVRLLVAGQGSQESLARARARELGLDDRVRFLGHVPWTSMPALFREADAFLFTSLRDSMGSVVLEAMAQALPIVTLDHQGVAVLVPDEAGFKVPVTTPADTQAAMAGAIRELAASPDLRRHMGEAAWTRARLSTWERRAEEMTTWYVGCASDAAGRHAARVEPLDTHEPARR